MSAATEISNVSISEIRTLAQMRAVEELQKEVWGIPDLDVVPLTHLVAAREAGGVLIGAFAGDALVGFVYGFPSFERGRLAHHSHMLAVKPEYRNFDLGRRLKFAQREHVLAQGIDLISWTFDPLQSLNAYFNFGKLGVVSDQYFPNFYGAEATSFLHQTGTDRLWVSWFVASERVPVSDAGGPTLVRVGIDEAPERGEAIGDEDQIAIEIPANIDALFERSPETAMKWRAETRRAFTEALEAGYFVESFIRDQNKTGKYLLTKDSFHAKSQSFTQSRKEELS
jgi:chorismate synthase